MGATEKRDYTFQVLLGFLGVPGFVTADLEVWTRIHTTEEAAKESL